MVEDCKVCEDDGHCLCLKKYIILHDIKLCTCITNNSQFSFTMTSATLVYDKLIENRTLTIWSVYHRWSSSNHEGFKIAAKFNDTMFVWETCELSQRVHPLLYTHCPKQANMNQKARDVVYKTVLQEVNYNDIMEKAWVAQQWWEDVVVMKNPTAFLNRELERSTSKPERIEQPKTSIHCI